MSDGLRPRVPWSAGFIFPGMCLQLSPNVRDGSPIVRVSLRMERTSLSSEDCPIEEHWLKFTPSTVQNSWRSSSSGSSCRLLIWLKSVMFVLFDCPTLFCVYLWRMSPVSVQPSRVLTPYGVPVGPVVNYLGTVAVNASASIRIPIRLSLIAGNLMFWRWEWCLQISFNISIWTLGIRNSCIAVAYTGILITGQLLHKAPLPIMTSAVLTECSPWSEASGRVMSFGCWTWSASATFCVIWVLSLPLSNKA